MRLAVAPAILAATLALASPAMATDGTWERTWGYDVIQSGHPGDLGTVAELCTVAADCKAGASGTGLLGEFGSPFGIASDASGHVYVATSNRIDQFDSDGHPLRAWGKDVVQSGQIGDTGTGAEICLVVTACKTAVAGTGLGGELNSPQGVTTDSAGNVYVAEFSGNRISEFDSQGNFIRAWGNDVIQSGHTGDLGVVPEVCTVAADCKNGVAGGLGGQMTGPADVAVDSSGNVYVAESNGRRVQKFDSTGGFVAAWGRDVIQTGHTGDLGVAPEICTVAADCKVGVTGALGGEFSLANNVALDPSGTHVYVADDGSGQRISEFSPSGTFLRTWGKDVITNGQPGDLGVVFENCTVAANCKEGVTGGLAGEFADPNGVDVDADGNVYVADFSDHRIQMFDPNGGFLRTWGKDVDSSAAGTGFEICTVAANCKTGVTGGLGGELSDSNSVATDPDGDLFVAEGSFGNRRISKFTTAAPSPPSGGGGASGGSATPPVSNAFSVGALKGLKLSLKLPAAGKVQVSDASAKAGRATASAKVPLLKTASVFGGPGAVTIKLKLTAAAKAILKQTGKVKVKARISFTPAGGTAASQTRALKLKQ